MKLIALHFKALFWGLMWDLSDLWVDFTQSSKAYKMYSKSGRRLVEIKLQIEEIHQAKWDEHW